MTKSEYYSVLNIQEVCKGLYFTPYTEVMRCVLQSLQMEFNAKYKGTPISIKCYNENFGVLINSYSITTLKTIIILLLPLFYNFQKIIVCFLK